VALIQERGSGWTLVALAPSVDEFVALDPAPKHGGTATGRLLGTCAALTSVEPTLVAIDIPLAQGPICGRRASDNAVSRAYGARKCGTHSPSVVRPGPVGERLTSQFTDAGYPLRTTYFEGRGLVEVYPHPALVELARADQRLTYKMGKRRAYWPKLSPLERRTKLLETWRAIADLLEEVVAGSRESLEPLIESGRLKAAEDALDGVVCAWVGSCILEGRAQPFGDDFSAIWIPKPMHASVAAG
jgi:predicted RNase H-like nuclease